MALRQFSQFSQSHLFGEFPDDAGSSEIFFEYNEILA
jgi:hypothetical protein